MRNKIKPGAVWLLEASNDDLCLHARSPRWAVHPAGASSDASGRPGVSRGGSDAPGIQREKIKKLVPCLPAIHADLLGADVKLLADTLELQVESLYRITTLTLAAVQCIGESQAAYLAGIVCFIAAPMSLTQREIPNEQRCRPDAATMGGAILRYGNDTAELISEIHAALNYIDIDLMGTWFPAAQRFL